MTCKHYKFNLDSDDRHYVNAPHLNNCVLCVAEKEGPLTQEEVGKYLGVGKMRISQIESRTIQKIKENFLHFFN